VPFNSLLELGKGDGFVYGYLT